MTTETLPGSTANPIASAQEERFAGIRFVLFGDGGIDRDRPVRDLGQASRPPDVSFSTTSNPFHQRRTIMMKSRFWVVGGEYTSCDCETIVQGTERVVGPSKPHGGRAHLAQPLGGSSSPGAGPLHHRPGASDDLERLKRPRLRSTVVPAEGP